MQYYFLFFLLILILPRNILALEINANISADTTWTLADSPININKLDFEVEDAARLTIEAGVQVYVNSEFIVDGELIVEGTAENPVVFDELVADAQWTRLRFATTSNPSCSDNDSVIEYLTLNNMASEIAINNRDVTFNNLNINIDGSRRYYFYANNSSDCEDRTVSIINSTLNYISANSGTKNEFIYMNNVNVILIDNDFDFENTGGAQEVVALKILATVKSGLSATIYNNRITVASTDSDSEFNFGIYTENDISLGSIDENTITVTALKESTGIYSEALDITDNNINLDANNSFPGDNIYGINNKSTSSSTQVTGNFIVMDVNTGETIGIDNYAGSIKNNQIIVNQQDNNSYLIGIRQCCYLANIENNSISMSINDNTLSTYGILINAQYHVDDIIVRNNIISMNSDSDNSIGLYKDDNVSTLQNNYNLIDNFSQSYSNVTAGAGDLLIDPLFTDPTSDLSLQAGSPAIDAGDWASTFLNEPGSNGGRVNMGAFGNRSDAKQSNITIIAPEIITNSGQDFSTSDGSLLLTGYSSLNTENISVDDGVLDGTLTYSAGESTWSYSAEMTSGSHTINLSSIDSDANTSASSTITITYNESEDNSPINSSAGGCSLNHSQTKGVNHLYYILAIICFLYLSLIRYKYTYK